MSRLFNTNELKASLKRGAPVDKYLIDLNIPNLIKDYVNISNINNYKVLAHKAILPGMSQNTITAWIRGQKIKLRSTNNFDNTFSITAYLDDEHSLKTICETWMKAADTFGNNVTSAYFANGLGGAPDSLLKIISKVTGNKLDLSSGYMTDITITQEKVDGTSPSVTYIMKHAYPIRTSDIQYDGTTPNQLASITVDFNYAYHISSNSAL